MAQTMDVLLQQYRNQGADRTAVTHTVTRKVGEQQVKLVVPPDDLETVYKAIGNDASPPAVLEHMGQSTAYSIDLKVCSVPGESIQEMVEGDARKTPAQPGLLVFAQYAAAEVAAAYGAAQPFLVYAAKYMDDKTTLPTVIMRAHFPGVLVNKERHLKLTQKIKESVEYRTLNNEQLVTQVVALGEFLHRCCQDQNSWPTALREQQDQEKRGMFRMVFADHVLPRAPAFDNCVLKPVAIFNSFDERLSGGTLEGVTEEDQALTHMKIVTKRPLDCPDTKEQHMSNELTEQTKEGEYVTRWIEPTVKKHETRTGYGGSVDTEPGAKPRSRNAAPDKRSNLNMDEFQKTWRQIAGRFVYTTEEKDGMVKYEIEMNNGKAKVTLNLEKKTATLEPGNMAPSDIDNVRSVFEAAATAGGAKK